MKRKQWWNNIKTYSSAIFPYWTIRKHSPNFFTNRQLELPRFISQCKCCLSLHGVGDADSYKHTDVLSFPIAAAHQLSRTLIDATLLLCVLWIHSLNTEQDVLNLLIHCIFQVFESPIICKTHTNFILHWCVIRFKLSSFAKCAQKCNPWDMTSYCIDVS